jgi:hypothetical protein
MQHLCVTKSDFSHRNEKAACIALHKSLFLFISFIATEMSDSSL